MTQAFRAIQTTIYIVSLFIYAMRMHIRSQRYEKEKKRNDAIKVHAKQYARSVKISMNGDK